MNTYLKSFVAAAALVGASMSVANAQDYTWTFSAPFLANYNGEADNEGNPIWIETGTERDGAGVSGTLTFHRNGIGDYTLTSWSINSTAGDGFAPGALAWSNSYTTGGENASANGAGDPLWDGGGSFSADIGDYVLDLAWEAGGVLAFMNSNALDAIAYFIPGQTRERDTNYSQSRTNGNCLPDEGCGDPDTGFLKLTSIQQVEPPPPTPTPEPASMALLGAGLLGLFAARRRKTA